VKLPGAGDGLLPVEKPAGPTSHDVVAMARRGLGTRRVGHTGTLDPFASGLLLLCVNRATRLAEYLNAHAKEYEAVARLGEETATLDVEGEVTRRSEAWKDLGEVHIQDALAALSGDQLQAPPAFSAKKVAGEASYHRARRGEPVVLEPVAVRIHELVLLELDLPMVRFRVRASTGTYVRSVARDLGERLGVGAHLRELRRTAIGPFRVEGGLPVQALDDEDAVRRVWVSPLEAVAHLPRVDLGIQEARNLQSGQGVLCPPKLAESEGPLAVAHDGVLLAIARMEGRLLRPRKVFPL